jgi:hypothetical protein
VGKQVTVEALLAPRGGVGWLGRRWKRVGILLHRGGGNGERRRACARGEKLGIPFIGERACEMDCERYLDARGGKLRSGVQCARRTVVAGGNGWRGPG